MGHPVVLLFFPRDTLFVTFWNNFVSHLVCNCLIDLFFGAMFFRLLVPVYVCLNQKVISRRLRVLLEIIIYKCLQSQKLLDNRAKDMH